jgi:hypothetical protein
VVDSPHDNVRQICADAIDAKEKEASRAFAITLALVAFGGGPGMWAGIAGGNGWAIAASVCALLAASFTKAGQLFWLGLTVLSLAALGGCWLRLRSSGLSRYSYCP